MSLKKIDIIELEKIGYTVAEFQSYEDFVSSLDNIGKTVKKSKIEVNKNKNYYLNSSNGMSLHTDHPDVDYIAWYCVRQKYGSGGESVLYDSEKILAQLNQAEIEELKCIKIKVPRFCNGTPFKEMIGKRSIYYADWLVVDSLSFNQERVLKKWKKLQLSSEKIRIQLGPKMALVINNRRMLHGRTSIHDADRLLVRHWLVTGESDSEIFK